MSFNGVEGHTLHFSFSPFDPLHFILSMYAPLHVHPYAPLLLHSLHLIPYNSFFPYAPLHVILSMYAPLHFNFSI